MNRNRIRGAVAALAALGPAFLAPPLRAQVGAPIHHSVVTASGTEHSLDVSLPGSYDTRLDAVYPVLYVLDGESNLDHAAAVVRFLADAGAMPETIVVGVHAGPTRGQDYLPPSDAEGVPAGRADRFLDELRTGIIPFIEEAYRAAPFRMLSGHSLGGVFVTFAALAEREAFGAYFAQSPYLDEAIGPTLVDSLIAIRDEGADRGFYFANVGAEPTLEPSLTRLGSALAEAEDPSRGAVVTEPDAGHMLTRLVGLYDGLVRFFGPFWPVDDARLAAEGAEGFDRYLREIETRLGYPPALAEATYRRTVPVLLQTGNVEGATRIGRRYAAAYPTSPTARFLLGNALAAGGDRAGAVAEIETAIRLYEADPDPRLAALYPNMKTLLGRLGG